MKSLIAIMFLAGATVVSAQITIMGPDYFGNQTIRGTSGNIGTISGPDYFGNRTYRYNNGATGTLSGPDYFGNRTFRYNQPVTMPRYNQYYRRW